MADRSGEAALVEEIARRFDDLRADAAGWRPAAAIAPTDDGSHGSRCRVPSARSDTDRSPAPSERLVDR